MLGQTACKCFRQANRGMFFNSFSARACMKSVLLVQRRPMPRSQYRALSWEGRCSHMSPCPRSGASSAACWATSFTHSVGRSGARPPSCPDVLSPTGRRLTAGPCEQMPAQCDVGVSSSKPVTWEKVVTTLPCMEAESTLRIVERVIRAEGHLLPDDPLQVVNLGPYFAQPLPDCGGIVPCFGRPLHVVVREPDMPARIPTRIALCAPHSAGCSVDQQKENLAALRQLFEPSKLEQNLQVRQDGWQQMHLWYAADDVAQKKLAAIHNQLLARTRVIESLQEALDTAPYRSKLEPIATNGIITWADLDCELSSPRAFLDALVKKWVKIPIWPSYNLTKQRRSQTKFHCSEYQLIFAQPQHEAQSGFIKSLLCVDRAFFITISDIDKFWRSPPQLP